MSRVSGDFPVQLATRLPAWSAGGLLRRSAAARVSCHSPNSTSPTCCGQVASMIASSSSISSWHASNILAKMPRGNCFRGISSYTSGDATQHYGSYMQGGTIAASLLHSTRLERTLSIYPTPAGRPGHNASALANGSRRVTGRSVLKGRYNETLEVISNASNALVYRARWTQLVNQQQK